MNSMNTPGTSHATALTSQRDALNGYGQTVPATRSSTAHTMNLPPRLGGSMDQTLPRFSNASTTSLPSMTSTSSSIPSANSYTHAHSNRQNLHNLRIATDSKVAPASGRPSPASARFNISAGPSSSLSLPGDHMWPSSLPLLPSFLQEVISASDVESQSQSFSSLRGSHSSQYKGDEYSPPNSVSSSQHSSPALEAVSLPTVPLSERHQAILDSVRPPTIFDMGIVTAESNTPVAPTARRPSNLFAVAGPPYLCDSCGKNFAIMHDLKRHQTTHIAGVKTTHLCPYCGKSFSRRDAVQRHVIAKKCTVAANNTHLGWPPPADHLPPAQ
ncbi:hypothetical protein PIIN_08273 [Serendipita indica DSM 11827]|uniref:C2H2-type domain-containing protein n=1 Tax=Serendipita indica (strain DSM 11827) TaxID=1109443 RepID=G4TSM7_SERID|nr:hypothetical protein PIIN_08273 [Serendipita indica DSM 11827]